MRLGVGQAFAGLGVGDLHQAVGLLGRGLGEFSASVRALATALSACWLAVSTALKAFTAGAGELDCTSTRVTWIPNPKPVEANSTRRLICCTKSPRNRSRRSAAPLSVPILGSGRATRIVSKSRAAAEGYRAARHQSIQGRQHMVALQRKGIGFE